jgi:hypothetical protein
MKPWRVCSPKVAAFRHFDEEQDPDPHRSELLDPDPHPNGKRDPDPDPTVVYLFRNTAIMPMLPASTLTVYPHPSSHFDEELDPNPHRSEQLDSDPNQNERGIRIQILQ